MKVKEFFKAVLAVLISLIVTVGVMYIGLLLPKSNVLQYIGYGSFIATVLIIIINSIILIYKALNKYNINSEKEINKIIKYQEEAKSLNKVYKKLHNKIIFFNTYLIVTILLQVLTIICAFNQGLLGVIFSIIAMIILLDILFSSIYKSNSELDYLNEKEVNKYNYLKLVLDKCVKLMNVKEEVNLIISEDEYTDTFKIKDKYYITIYLKDLMLLNEEEFETILIYELGRIYNGDINLNERLNKATPSFDSFEDIYLSFFLKNIIFKPMIDNLQKEKSLYNQFTIYHRMLLADEWLLKKNKTQVYINALAKTTLKKFFQEDRFYLNEYKLEEPITNYYEWYISRMFREFDRNKEMYLDFLNKYINTPFATDPTLKERMEKLGVNKFNIDFSYNGTARFYEEIQEIISNFDNKWYEQHNQTWNDRREIAYLLFLNIHNSIKDKDFEKLGLKEQLNFAYAEYRLGDYVTASECYEKILEKYPNHIYSLKQMGKLKFFNNDPSCIDYFLKVKQLDVLTTENMNKYIESFYIYNGLTEQMQEQFMDSLEGMKTFNLISKYQAKNGNKVYQNNDLPKDIIKEFKNKVNSYSFIDKAYLLKKNYLEDKYEYELIVYTKEEGYTSKDLMKMSLDLSMFVLIFDEYIIEYKLGIKNRSLDKYIEKNEIRDLMND